MSGSLSLERGLSVLEVLKNSHDPIGVRDIARRLDLSAPAVQRLLNTLSEKSYVQQVAASRRYRVGHAVLGLAQHVLCHDRLIGVADVELRALASQGSFNGFLGARHGDVGVYLLAIQSNSPVVIRATPGETMPLHTTALGKALLLGLDDAEIGALLGEGPLERATPRSVTSPAKLIEQLATTRSLDYTTALDENLVGIISVGAPVRDASGAVVAAISVAFPRAVAPHIRIAEVGQRVLESARRISTQLGFDSVDAHADGEPVDAA